MKKIHLLLLLLLSSFSYAQTGITITYHDGASQSFSIASAGKLYFVSDNLYVKTDAITTPTTIPVSIIRRITFSNSLSAGSFGENKNNLVLYPNPSSEIIKIKSDVEEELEVKIYSLTGQLVKKGTFLSNQSIDVSALSQGLYLVQVNNLTIKFSKK